jgi:hypothetical protein
VTVAVILGVQINLRHDLAAVHHRFVLDAVGMNDG